MNYATVSSCASTTLRAVSCKVLSNTVANAKAEAAEFLAWYIENVNRDGSVILRFNGEKYINYGQGWRKPNPEKPCKRCGGHGISTSSGGIGCFVCGRAGKGSDC